MLEAKLWVAGSIPAGYINVNTHTHVRMYLSIFDEKKTHTKKLGTLAQLAELRTLNP